MRFFFSKGYHKLSFLIKLDYSRFSKPPVSNIKIARAERENIPIFTSFSDLHKIPVLLSDIKKKKNLDHNVLHVNYITIYEANIIMLSWKHLNWKHIFQNILTFNKFFWRGWVSFHLLKLCK